MSGTAVPSWMGSVTFPTRNGLFHVGDTITGTLTKSGATGYEVRDFYGTVVSSGAVTGTSFAPSPPAGGWRPGWYRVYCTGPNTDAVTGNAYAAAMFTVLRQDSRFPPNPAPPVGDQFAAYHGGEDRDIITKAVLGMGTSRLIIGTYADPTAGNSTSQHSDSIYSAQQSIALSRTYWHAGSYTDPARQRLMWCSTPGACADKLGIAGSSSGTFLAVYARTPSVDSSQVYVAVAAGTSSGTKVTVSYPDAATVVETYDNLTSSSAAETAVNASSAYVKVFSKGASAGATTAATAIGRTVWNGVVQTVQALYPDVTRYEFTNEPAMTAETAHQMRLFQAAVHAGNADAKAIGPCPVSLNIPAWTAFLAGGGGSYCDELSFHDYNTLPSGNLATASKSIGDWLALLQAYGQDGKVRWQTEAGARFTAVAQVHHPRRSRAKILHALLWEQYGVPRERNVYWYDRSHGFWSYPAYLLTGNGHASADGVLLRTLAEETFGMTHTARLDFGAMGNRVALGSLYAGTSAGCVVVCGSSGMPNATATIALTGASGTLVTVDAFGNLGSVTVANGRITVPLVDVPLYVRVPVGVTAAGVTINDWPASTAWQSVTGPAVITGSASGAQIAGNGRWLETWGQSGEVYLGAYALPDTATFQWETGARADRLVIFAGPLDSVFSTLVDFDAQTSNDGATWITRATVTKAAPTSFRFGTGTEDGWTTLETYWDEQYIFDVPLLGGPYEFKYLRLYVRSTSYGGEPDATCGPVGQGDNQQRVVLQEVAVMCDDNTQLQYVRA